VHLHDKIRVNNITSLVEASVTVPATAQDRMSQLGKRINTTDGNLQPLFEMFTSLHSHHTKQNKSFIFRPLIPTCLYTKKVSLPFWGENNGKPTHALKNPSIHLLM